MRPLLPLVALLLVLATAPVAADDTQTRRYVASPVSVEPCAPGCDLDGPGPLGPVSVGRMEFHVAGPYGNLLLAAQDDVTGTPPVAACYADPEGEPTCSAEETGFAVTCGAAVVLDSPFRSDRLHVWVTNLHVESDLAFCAGTTGTMTVTMW